MEYGIKADIWLNTGGANSLSQINSELPVSRMMPSVKSRNVYNNNNVVNLSGGNDFWESGVVNPQVILEDLIKIFHPQVIDHDLVYYKQLE